MAIPPSGLRAEVEIATAEAVEQAASGEIDRGALVRSFLGRGASRTTLFRWIAEHLEGGAAGQAVARRVRQAAEERAAAAGVEVPDEPGQDARAEASIAAAQLPLAVRIEDVAGSGGALDAISKLNACIAAAEKVMRYASHPDGDVRAPKLILAAAETLRRCLDTATRLHEALRSVQEVDRFHQAVLDELALESPALAARVVARLSAVAGRYGA